MAHLNSFARQSLRTHISGDRCIKPLSVFDPVTARMAEDHGADAMMLAGSVASMVHLGDPDLMTLALPELGCLSGRIARAANIPLIVDADHGFGNALNVRRTVMELEREGVSALTIEDTELPTAFGNDITPRLIPKDEAVGKMHAALAARSDPGMIIIGRTGATGLGDIADTIDRLQAYEAAGVDMVFIRAVKTAGELNEISDAMHVPIMLSPSNPDLRDLDLLSKTKVRIVLAGHRPIMAAYRAASDAMASDMSDADAPDSLPKEKLRAYTKKDQFDAMAQSYLTPKPDVT